MPSIRHLVGAQRPSRHSVYFPQGWSLPQGFPIRSNSFCFVLLSLRLSLRRRFCLRLLRRLASVSTSSNPATVTPASALVASRRNAARRDTYLGQPLNNRIELPGIHRVASCRAATKLLTERPVDPDETCSLPEPGQSRPRTRADRECRLPTGDPKVHENDSQTIGNTDCVSRCLAIQRVRMENCGYLWTIGSGCPASTVESRGVGPAPNPCARSTCHHGRPGPPPEIRSWHESAAIDAGLRAAGPSVTPRATPRVALPWSVPPVPRARPGPAWRRTRSACACRPSASRA